MAQYPRTLKLQGATIVDLFAGSGALGLEALSRGAAHATFVELNAPSLAALKANIAALDAADRTEVRRGDAMRFALGLEAHAFDVALADPPFAGDFALQLAAEWAKRPFARVLAVEHSPKVVLPDGATRRWGDIAVTFYHSP